MAHRKIKSHITSVERLDDAVLNVSINMGQAAPDIVDWSGADDRENPLNWPFRKKAGNIAIVSAMTFISPLASSIFAPAIPQVMSDFETKNEELASFVVSVYVLGYAFGPLAISPLSEFYGRSRIYQACNAMFLIFTIACALAPSLAALIVFRFLAGIGGSCPVAIGAASVADMVRQEHRGKVMSIWIFGPLLGPIIGPIAGGYLSQIKGWRWCFWVLSLAASVIALICVPFLKETYPSTILQLKTKRLRKETGNQRLRSALGMGLSTKKVFITAIARPTKLLLFSPVIMLLSLYMFTLYGYLYLIFTAIPYLFQREYHFSTGQVGLAYLGIGTGLTVGLFISGLFLDRWTKLLTHKNGGEFRPEYRLPLMMVASITVPIGLLFFGWTANIHIHWIFPMIGASLLGCGITLAFMATSTYLVDSYPMFAASAVGASTVLRSLGGAMFPLAGEKMFHTFGLGWGSSLLAFIALAMAPIPVIFYKYGAWIRQRVFFNIEL